MRQMCPNCVRLIELPESAAGTDTVCPECGKSFRVPGSYTPSVDPNAGPAVPQNVPPAPPAPAPAVPTRPVPPPGFVPPAPPAPPPVDGTAPLPSGYAKSAALPLAPNVVPWVPAVCLTLVLLLSFFSWVGSYPGGTAIYTQSPWGGLFAGFTVNTFDKEALQDEAAIKKNIHTDWLLLFYFLVLFLTVAIAWAERVASLTKVNVPPALATVWPLRFTILTGLAGGLFLILLMQSWHGFGLELAIQKTVAAKNEDKAAQAVDTADKNRVALQTALELARYALQTTTAFSFAILAHLVAILALLAAWWLDRRGAKPVPRVVLYW